MTTTDKNCNMHLRQLVHLGHELDDLSAKIDLLAVQLNHGYVDHDLFDTAIRQVQVCGVLLATVPYKHSPRRGK